MSAIPWSLVYTGVITFISSGFLSYFLDRRKGKNEEKKEKITTYKELIDAFSDSHAKNNEDVENIDSLIKRERPHFEKEIRERMPESFKCLWVRAELIIDKAPEGQDFAFVELSDIDGGQKSSFNYYDDKEAADTYFWFESERDRILWEGIAKDALKSYNEHTRDIFTVGEWKFRTVPQTR